MGPNLLAQADSQRRAAGTEFQGRKVFFFEKKKQKEYVEPGGT
jgi:hypothetical protein